MQLAKTTFVHIRYEDGQKQRRKQAAVHTTVIMSGVDELIRRGTLLKDKELEAGIKAMNKVLRDIQVSRARITTLI